MRPAKDAAGEMRNGFFRSEGWNEADQGLLDTANNEASAWALYKKEAARGDAELNAANSGRKR